MVDPPHILAPYESLARRIVGEEGTDQERALRLLKYVAELGGHYTEATTSSVTQSDNVATIMEDVRSGKFKGNCAHYSMILQTLAQAGGLDARIVALHADRWIDGWGHALNEVYLPEWGSWAVLDPLNHVYFLDESGRPLSVLDLRKRFLAGKESGIL